MRSPASMETIQIELTNACVLKCSNCTRFCGSQYQPFFITEEQFTAAVDSLVDYPKQNPNGIVGFMGGEPTLHPLFEKFCAIALERIPREHLGLWSTFPPAKRKYRDIICRTFGQVLLNDHSRDDIMHAPVLVAIEEVFKDKDERFMWSLIDRCWVQNSWSASVTPKGAYFCEVAAAMANSFGGSDGWKVEPGWWKRQPEDFKSQMNEFCRKCGCAVPLARRKSQDNRDDISAGNLARLKGKSRKVDTGQVVANELKIYRPILEDEEMYPRQTYKDFEYRAGIAARFGIYLTVNDRNFLEPHLMSGGPEDWPKQAAASMPAP